MLYTPKIIIDLTRYGCKITIPLIPRFIDYSAYHDRSSCSNLVIDNIPYMLRGNAANIIVLLGRPHVFTILKRYL